MISEETKQDYYLGGYDAGIEEGMEKGREEGRAEERRANAKAFLDAGFPAETVSAVLGISLEELAKL